MDGFKFKKFFFKVDPDADPDPGSNNEKIKRTEIIICLPFYVIGRRLLPGNRIFYKTIQNTNTYDSIQ